MIRSYHPIASSWWIHKGYLVNLWVSSWSIVPVSTAQKFLRPPVWLFPNYWFDSAFFRPCFGQEYFNTRLHSYSYVPIMRSLWIWGLPVTFGNMMTINVIHLLSGFSLRRAIEVILWWIFHILSLISSLSSLYWVPSGESKLWWWPKCLPDGEVVVDSYHFLNPCLYSLKGIWLFVFVLTISLFCCRLWRFFFYCWRQWQWCNIWCSI